MTKEYGKWIREHRTMHCPVCDDTIDTEPIRYLGPERGEVRRCDEGHEFITGAWIVGSPKDAERFDY
ncbi:hypothetical protein ABZ319_05450 [Nocardia sp. NPDC005978]|uniref:hypothetical protein n=1 Tax=Nocardia sp. NPDC005978 TaxID=3156725 RepID=UPI0033BA48C3